MNFGRGVTRVVVGAAVLAGGRAHGEPCELAKVLASDGAVEDYFGESVSVSGDVAVVGSIHDDDNGDSSGSAYVYRRDGSGWVQEAKLLASDGAAGDYFGGAVAVSGDVAVVGADFDDDNGYNSGSAYVFRWDGSGWVQEQKLLAADGEADDHFGSAVSVSGDVALVGAENDDDNGRNAGSAYVFRWDGSGWMQEAKPLASDGSAHDEFGHAVSVSGDLAVVGAWRADDNGEDSGSAYAYGWNGSGWVQEAKLLASDTAEGDNFGNAVSVSGDLAVVAAHWDDDDGPNSGSAYAYRRYGSGWVQEQKLLASDAASGDNFGQSVSVSGDVALVGAHTNDDYGTYSGSAYVYRWNGSNWVQEAKLLSSDGSAFDLFGVAVSVSGDVAVVGARWDADNGYRSGSAYVYELECPGPAVLDIKPGSCPNSFNCNSNGVLPVALAGTELFDVLEVDLASVYLVRADGIGGAVAPHEGPPGPHSVFTDVAAPTAGETCECIEAGGDGITDLSMKFKSQEVVAALELPDLPPGALVELILIGERLDGTSFTASDCIRLVPTGTPSDLLNVESNAPGAPVDVTSPDAG